MRSLFWFLAAIAVSLLAATAAAYPLYHWLNPTGAWWVDGLASGVHAAHANWRIDKIASRLFDLFLLVSLIGVVRHLRLRGSSAWGWDVSRPLAARQFTVGLVLGILTMTVVSVTMVRLGARPMDPTIGGAEVLGSVRAGIGSGLVVGLVEETLFRGLIQGAASRGRPGTVFALVAVSALFAAVHFLASVHIAHADVTPESGAVLLRGTLLAFAQPASLADSFCALFAVGVLTGLARILTGNVLFAAGLHAGWVMIMRVTVGITALPVDSERSWLISAHDGYTGWLVVAYTGAFLVVAFALRHPLQRWLRVGGRFS